MISHMQSLPYKFSKLFMIRSNKSQKAIRWHSQSVERKKSQKEFFKSNYPSKLSIYSWIKLRELVYNIPDLQDILKEILQTESKWHQRAI